MFEKLHYRKLKKLYNYVLYWVNQNKLKYMQEDLEIAYNLALTLFNKMHQKSINKNTLLFEDWQEVERILTNLSTIYKYFCVYSSYKYFLQHDSLVQSGRYEQALKTAQKARFSFNDSYKYREFPINEPSFMVEKGSQTSPCEGMQELISVYKKAFGENISSISYDRECELRKRIEKQKESYNNTTTTYYDEGKTYQKDEQRQKDVEKCKEKVKDLISWGDSLEYVRPADSLGYYKSAHRYASEFEELSEEKEHARRCVVAQYIIYANSVTTTAYYGSAKFRMNDIKKALEILEDADDWTEDWDHYKISDLRKSLESDYSRAETDYIYED